MSAASVQKIAPAGGGSTSHRLRALPTRLAPIAVACGILVIVAHSLTIPIEQRVGVYLSGIITLAAFVAVGWYSARKRMLWFSVRVLYAARRILPEAIFERLVFLDRLETWRAFHVVVAMLALLPFWWHMQRHLMGPLEAALAAAVALLFASGFFGVVIQDVLPHQMTRFDEHEVRSQDVNAKINAIYVEAEEKILGHQEALVQTYLARIKPILVSNLPSLPFLFATLASRDFGPRYCADLLSEEGKLGADAPVWRELVDLTIRKVNLEHNDFNLWLSISWLRFHVVTAILTGILVTFHVLAVLYYGGT